MLKIKRSNEKFEESIVNGEVKSVPREVEETEDFMGVVDEEPIEQVKPKDDWNAPREVEETEEFLGVVDEEPIEQPKTSDSTEVMSIVEDDFGSESLARAEESYEATEFNNKVQPILEETTKKAVGEAVKYQQDKLKLEMQEVLQDEVSYRLSRYEKRRRWRDIKTKVGTAIKVLILLGVIGFVLGNAQLRLRIAIVARDVGDLCEAILSGDENVSSNQLVEDMFRDLGEDLNEVNTVESEVEEE